MADTVRLRWRSPQYRGAIYAGTMPDPDSIKIDTYLTLDNPAAGYTFTVTIIRNAATIKTFTGIQVDGLEQTLELDTASITFAETRSGPYVKDDNPYEVRVDLVRSGVQATKSLELHKYPAIGAGGGVECRYDDTGRFIRDGVPDTFNAFYVYSGDLYTDAVYAKMKGWGINTIMDTSQGDNPYSSSNISFAIGAVASVYYKVDANGGGDPEGARGTFTSQRSQPKLVAYRNCDEPMHGYGGAAGPTRDWQKCKQIYEIAKEEDPYHPAICADTFGGVLSSYNMTHKRFVDFTECFDAFWCDTYTIKNRLFDNRDGAPDIGHMYNQLPIRIGEQFTYPKDREYSMLFEDELMAMGSIHGVFFEANPNDPADRGRDFGRIPTEEEQTNNVYQSIVIGSSQLCPFAYQNDASAGPDVTLRDPAWAFYGTLVDELEAEGNALMVGARDNTPVTVSYTGIPNEQDRVIWTRRVTDTHEYVVLVSTIYQYNYNSDWRTKEAVITVTFGQAGSTTVDAIRRDGSVQPSYTLTNNSMTLTLSPVHSGNGTSGVAVLKRAITAGVGSPPVISPVTDRTHSTSNLPQEYPLEPFVDTDSGALTGWALVTPPTGFSIDANGVITAAPNANVAANTITFIVANDEGASTADFTWTITAVESDINLTEGYAVDRTPVSAVVGCTSDSIEGIAYAGVSLTEYTDEAVLKDPSNPQHVWQGEAPAAIDIVFTATGLTPEADYHYAIYQEDLTVATEELVDFRTSTGGFTFNRPSPQAAPDANGNYVNRPSGAPVHPFADWDGNTYTNTSALSKGVLLEPAGTRYNPYAYTDAQFSHDGVTNGGTTAFGALTLTKLEEIDGDSGQHAMNTSATTPDSTQYTLSAILAADTRVAVDIYNESNGTDWAHVLWDFVNDTSGYLQPGLDGNGNEQLTADLYRTWYARDSGVGGGTRSIGVGGVDSADIGNNVYVGEGGNGLKFHLSLESGLVPTSPMIGEGAQQNRAETSLTAALTTLNMTPAENNISFQLPITVNFDYDSGLPSEDLITIGSGNDKLVVSISGGAVTLTKTAGGVATSAAVTGLTYVYGDRLNIKGMLNSGTGLKLWVDAATGTHADPTGFGVAPASVTIHPARIIAEQFRYVDAADDATVGGWT